MLTWKSLRACRDNIFSKQVVMVSERLMAINLALVPEIFIEDITKVKYMCLRRTYVKTSMHLERYFQNLKYIDVGILRLKHVLVQLTNAYNATK